MHNLLRDFKMARRALGRSPAFTAAAVLTLALGVGTSTAIFSVVDAAVLRALPFPRPEGLVFVLGAAGEERDLRAASFLEARDWAAHSRAFAELAPYDRSGVAASWGDEAEQLRAEIVSPSYFTLLRARPARGRTFLPAEDQVLDRDAVAVISHDLWQRRFGGSAQVVGRDLTLNRRRFTVVGVMPEGFHGVAFDAEVWVPMAMATILRPESALQDRGDRWLSAVGRLRPGTALGTAQADMDRVARQLASEHPDENRDRWAVVQPLRDAVLGSTAGLLRAILGGALLLLVVACANVTALQLVRATGRERQVAVFRALGASTGRVVRHQLAEGLLLAAAGGAGGLLAARALLSVLLRRLPDGLLAPYVQPQLDGRVLLFALAATAGCAALFGALPALRGLRVDLSQHLRRGAPAGAGGLGDLARPRPQQLLVIAEVALSLVLLVAAGLLGRTLLRLARVDPGFAPPGQLAVSLQLPAARYSRDQRFPTAVRLQAALAALPGVDAVAVGSDLPLRGATSAGFLHLRDNPTPDGVRFYRHRVLPGYFSALRIPILRGRAIGAEDRADGPGVVVVSRALARRFWGEAQAVGKRLSLDGPEGPWVEVVGVAGDVRYRDLTTDLGLAASEPDVYMPFAQRPDNDLEVALRTSGDPAKLAALARAAVAGLDPDLPLYQVETLEDVLAGQTAMQRLGTLLLGAFAAVALALAAIGIYGVIAYVVGRSSREIALRMALGGRARTIVGLVVRQGMLLAVLGVGGGLAAAAALSRALAGLLFEVAAIDPLTFTLVPVALLAIALAASVVPAWRAARLEPQAVLRGD